MPYCDRIDSTITQLRRLTQQTVQASWHYCLQDLPIDQALDTNDWQKWPQVSVNDRQHVAWSKGEQVMWLGQQYIVPTDLNHYPVDGLTLRLSLMWWAVDAQVFVNGQLVQQGDLYDCAARVVLAVQVTPEDTVSVAIRLVSPGHDDGALVKSVLLYEMPDHGVQPVPEPGFVADELAVLMRYCKAFAPEHLTQVANTADALLWERVGDRQSFDKSMAQMRQSLLPLSGWIKQRVIKLLGHAHLDLAWLWPIPETWEVAQRTFESALQLQQDYPDLIFGHSTPMLYEWMEQHRPDLFSCIQARINQGQWEAIAGLWVEPELNILGGESIVRQVLYGQRYCQEKFRQISRIAWLPDTFGFCWQLPQILAQGGIDYFVTQKLRWNDTTEFPYQWFEWRSPDGTGIHSLMSAPIGTTIDPVQMADYGCTWEQATGYSTCLWLPGVGDHGGGPTRDMIELAHRWQQSPFFPTVEFSSAIAFLDSLRGTEAAEGIREPEGISKPEGVRAPEVASQPKRVQEAEGISEIQHPMSPSVAVQSAIQKPTLPHWSDELYLELHRGCYTAHADQKYWNRRCEALLYEAELWSSLATWATGVTYPKQEIESTWKTVLFNQFHDILPGSSIAEVYAEVNPLWEQAATTAENLIQEALEAIASHIQPPTLPPSPLASPPLASPPLASSPLTVDSIPVTIFNPLNWLRTDVVSIPIPATYSDHTTWSAHTTDGTILPCQYHHNARNNPTLLIQPPPIPGIGYTLLWITPLTPVPSSPPSPPSHYQLENTFLQVTIDPNTGDIQDLMDKQSASATTKGHPVFHGPGNQLLAFKDDGEYWDAWNIAPNYLDHPLPSSTLESIQWVANGPVEQRIRVIRQLGQSTFTQDYVLQANSPVLWVENHVEWRDRHTVVKVAFPFTHSADFATYDMPFGAIQRSTCPTNPADQAKWEVPGLAWADLTTTAHEQYGVSILSDYKHGYSATSSELRLTLLRGPIWPDPNADQGHHRFCYGIYPHAGSC
ncbi:MAG: alpha-mannosidase, partial [Merismopedia sp. SIO2A8]|nr:alpha-mannosidase [Merismopedia sp. SIO2A8]